MPQASSSSGDGNRPGSANDGQAAPRPDDDQDVDMEPVNNAWPRPQLNARHGRRAGPAAGAQVATLGAAGIEAPPANAVDANVAPPPAPVPAGAAAQAPGPAAAGAGHANPAPWPNPNLAVGAAGQMAAPIAAGAAAPGPANAPAGQVPAPVEAGVGQANAAPLPAPNPADGAAGQMVAPAAAGANVNNGAPPVAPNPVHGDAGQGAAPVGQDHQPPAQAPAGQGAPLEAAQGDVPMEDAQQEGPARRAVRRALVRRASQRDDLTWVLSRQPNRGRMAACRACSEQFAANETRITLRSDVGHSRYLHPGRIAQR